jgi:hypothetical protein
MDVRDPAEAVDLGHQYFHSAGLGRPSPRRITPPLWSRTSVPQRPKTQENCRLLARAAIK